MAAHILDCSPTLLRFRAQLAEGSLLSPNQSGPVGCGDSTGPLLGARAAGVRRTIGAMSAYGGDEREFVEGADEPPPLVTAHAQTGVPADALKMGFDRNTEEGALIAMAGSLNPAKPTHKVVAWVLLVAFAMPLLLSLWNFVF